MNCMKKKYTILLLVLSINVFAQFPEPKSFSFSYEYIELDDWGVCNNHTVFGPSYCSYFDWQIPDTITTTAKLVGYNIYIKRDTTISKIITLTNTYYTAEMGVIGSVWVTALYSNPDGESLPSNIVENESLPVAIKEIKMPDKIKIYYIRNSQTLVIDCKVEITKLNLINSNTKILKCIQNPSNTIVINDLETGFYIVEIYTKEGQIFRQKIIK